jgi:hypothetical protein
MKKTVAHIIFQRIASRCDVTLGRTTSVTPSLHPAGDASLTGCRRGGVGTAVSAGRRNPDGLRAAVYGKGFKQNIKAMNHPSGHKKVKEKQYGIIRFI